MIEKIIRHRTRSAIRHFIVCGLACLVSFYSAHFAAWVPLLYVADRVPKGFPFFYTLCHDVVMECQHYLVDLEFNRCRCHLGNHCQQPYHDCALWGYHAFKTRQRITGYACAGVFLDDLRIYSSQLAAELASG